MSLLILYEYPHLSKQRQQRPYRGKHSTKLKMVATSRDAVLLELRNGRMFLTTKQSLMNFGWTVDLPEPGTEMISFLCHMNARNAAREMTEADYAALVIGVWIARTFASWRIKF